MLKRVFLLILFVFCLGLAYSQTTIDFETEGSGYTPSDTEGSGNTDVFNRANPNIGGNSTYIWAVEDISLTDPSITLDAIDITGSSTFSFSIDFLTPNSEDWDTTDELLITYSVDGGASQNLMWVQSNEDGDAFNAPAALDLDFDGTGDDGQELPAINDDFGAGVGSNFATFTRSDIAISGSSMVITMQFNGLDSTAEGIYIDNIVITPAGGGGSSASLAINHYGLTESNLNGAEISLVLSNETFSGFDTGDVTLNNAPAGTSVNSVSNSDDTNGTVTLAFDGTDFDNDISDFSITISADGLAGTEGVTSNDLTITAVIEPDPEPDNHVTGFEASEDGSSSIIISWTDATGTDLPSGYLIMMNTSDSFTDPVDGTAVEDDANNLNIAFGVESAEWTDLDSETQYFFKIYPYSNSGSDISYKTDGIVPTANATTEAIPSSSLPYSEDFTGQNGKGAYGNSNDGTTVDLSGVNWTVEVGGTLETDTSTNYFYVENEEFVGIDVDGSAYWFSPIIDVASVSSIDLSIDLAIIGGGANAGGENITVYYSLDPTSETPVYNVVDSFDQSNQSQLPKTVTQEAIDVDAVNNFKLRVEIDSNGGGDGFSFDNVSVGESSTPSAVLTISHTGLTEENLDGAIINLTLTNETFNNFISDDVTINNAPSETTINSVSGTNGEGIGTVTLAFDGTDFDSDINNFSITVSADGLSGIEDVQSNEITITAVIESDPDLPQLIISEVADPGDDPDSKFVEIFNPGDSMIDFDMGSWYLSRQANGGNIEDIELTGTIYPHNVYVIANTSANIEFYNLQSGFISGNGNDGYFLYYNGDHSTGTLIDAYGVINQNGSGTSWDYEDSHAQRNDSVSTPNTTWTASEWTITAANVADCNPGAHQQNGVLHQTQNANAGETLTFPTEAVEEIAITIDEGESGEIQASVSMYDSHYPGAANTYQGWWDINVSGNTQPVDLLFTYSEADLGVITESDLAVYHQNGSNWENIGGTVNEAANQIELHDYNGSFSPFTLGDKNSTPLPITLSSFLVTYSSPFTHLLWVTSSEINNAGWNIYRNESDDFATSMNVNNELIPGQGTTLEATSYSFTDEYPVNENTIYYYWLESLSYSGVSEKFGPISIEIPPEGEDEIPELPPAYELMPNYPNPFNPLTTIKYNLPLESNVELNIYNLKGKKVKTLVYETQSAGFYKVTWNGKNDEDLTVTSGIYFYKLATENYVESRSMLLMK